MQVSRANAALGRAPIAGAGLLAAFLCAGQARAQVPQRGRTFETIRVTGSRPVAKAMDIIEKRYGVLIDDVDPQYVAPQDLDLFRSFRGRPLPRPTVGPKTRTISVGYWQVPGTPKSVAPIYRCNVATLGCAPVTARPEDGIATLIQQVLDGFAEEGGQVFTVQKLEMPYGPRWEVYPTEARDLSGAFVAQPDLLAANMSVPRARRWPAEMFGLIAQQLTRAWGVRFSVALLWWTIDPHMPGPGQRPPQLGAEDVSAWRVIADLMGPRGTLGVLRVRYGLCGPPGGGNCYGINVVSLPDREPPRPPTPAAVPARPAPPRPPGYWLRRARTPEGIQEIQRGLAKLGYLQTAPTTRWDANATAALRRFQYAVGLPQTGKFDRWTALMLSPSLPLWPQFIAAKPAMDPQLAYWLADTLPGMKEVQRVLTGLGFYSGPIDGEMYLRTAKALEAFQTVNGLHPTGMLDYATAVKLAPFLPKPN
jgi:peptidoglycan hydrolase-like protein with peptidoglycan-binding domain